MKVIAGKSILHNTVTDYVFIASELDEKTQLSHENHQHIKWIGELTDAVEIKKPNLPQGNIGLFGSDLKELINSYSLENGSNTPDYILAQYLLGCLDNWNKHVMLRSDWYGNRDSIGYLIDNL